MINVFLQYFVTRMKSAFTHQCQVTHPEECCSVDHTVTRITTHSVTCHLLGLFGATKQVWAAQLASFEFGCSQDGAIRTQMLYSVSIHPVCKRRKAMVPGSSLPKTITASPSAGKDWSNANYNHSPASSCIWRRGNSPTDWSRYPGSVGVLETEAASQPGEVETSLSARIGVAPSAGRPGWEEWSLVSPGFSPWWCWAGVPAAVACSLKGGGADSASPGAWPRFGERHFNEKRISPLSDVLETN